MKFKAVPFVEKPIAVKKFRDFLLQKFEVGNLYRFNEDSNTLFLDWKGTDMGSWFRFVNPNSGRILEFFEDEYKIHSTKGIFVFPYPRNLNEFISDCRRVGVTLYWDADKLDTIFDHKIYASQKETDEYYKEMLTIIEKENVF